MFVFNNEPTNERNLHGKHKSQNKESGVGCVDSVRKSSHEQKYEYMKGNQVNNEHISTPRRNLQFEQFKIMFSQLQLGLTI